MLLPLLLSVLMLPGSTWSPAAADNVTEIVRVRYIDPYSLLSRLHLERDLHPQSNYPNGIVDVYDRGRDSIVIRGTRSAVARLRRQMEEIDRMAGSFVRPHLLTVRYRLFRVQSDGVDIRRSDGAFMFTDYSDTNPAIFKSFNLFDGLGINLTARVRPNRSVEMTGQIIYRRPPQQDISQPLDYRPSPFDGGLFSRHRAPRLNLVPKPPADMRIQVYGVASPDLASPRVTRILPNRGHGILIGLVTSGSLAVQTMADAGIVPIKPEPFTAWYLEITGVEVGRAEPRPDPFPNGRGIIRRIDDGPPAPPHR